MFYEMRIAHIWQPAPDLDNPVPEAYRWEVTIPLNQEATPEDVEQYAASFFQAVNSLQDLPPRTPPEDGTANS